jgi:hypothetical protein
MFVGTSADNIADMVRKGRAAVLSGEKNGFARLTDSLVVSIRERLATGERGTSIARDIGVDPTTVYLAGKGRTWRHVPLFDDVTQAVVDADLENILGVTVG